jgi:L-serine dehydratase
MALSVFDIFKIGIGPSSSHTVGPMLAAWHFSHGLIDSPLRTKVARIQVDLHGSLGTTGRGHATDRAVVLGLSGELPECITQERIHQLEQQLLQTRRLQLGGLISLPFQPELDIFFHQENLPAHPNGMCLTALDAAGDRLLASKYYSVGGGFVQDEQGHAIRSPNAMEPKDIGLPHFFVSGDDLLEACERSGLSIAQLMWENELQWRSGDEIRSRLRDIWQTMREAIDRGCRQHGTLPGSRVLRRAASLHDKLTHQPAGDGLDALDWVNLYAMAVNEENACGGRVVTAPTNGAAGVVPAVLQHHLRNSTTDSEQSIIDFLLTAAAIGIVYKQTGSLSGAEVGCQGEVGVASSMAAAGLAAVMGGVPGRSRMRQRSGWSISSA